MLRHAILVLLETGCPLQFMRTSGNRSFSIQEQPCLCVLYYPLEPLLQVHTRHRTAGHDGPLVCFDRVQLEALCGVNIGLATRPEPQVSRYSPVESHPQSSHHSHRFCS